MLPEIGATELLVIAVVALIVVGPKDLPMLLRKLGQFTAKLRGMAAEFRSGLDDLARQSELEELRKEVDAMRNGRLSDAAAEAIDVPVTQAFDDIHRSLQDVSSDFHAVAYDTPPMLTAPEPEPAAKPKAPRKAAPATAKPKAAAKAAAPKARPATRKPKSGPKS